MTEPVAYIQIKDGKAYSVLRKGTPNDQYTPVYTAEQLRPRVKMTKKQNDIIITCLANNISFYKFYGENVLEKELFANLTETDLLEAWLNPWSIEIIPDMKWFVRSKKRDDEGDYAFLSGIETVEDWGYSEHHDGVNEARARAYPFDTQDEAELWVTPITEAVQLSVEGE